MKKCPICIVIILTLFSCTSFPTLAPVASATTSGPRTIIIDGKTINEDETGGFISWYCIDSVYGGEILVEVGFFRDPNLEGFGFILYDGGYTGTSTYYQRTGLEHRWDWGPNENDYAFVVKSDGVGLYYDFSYANPEEKIKAREVYKCYKR